MANKEKTNKIIMTGLMMALTTIATMMIAMRTVYKRVHSFGRQHGFMSVLILGWRYGAVAAGVGSALADVFSVM